MDYMTRLTGTARTNAPVVSRSVATTADAKRLAAAWERTDEDSASFREHRALMFQRYGVCG